MENSTTSKKLFQFSYIHWKMLYDDLLDFWNITNTFHSLNNGLKEDSPTIKYLIGQNANNIISTFDYVKPYYTFNDDIRMKITKIFKNIDYRRNMIMFDKNCA